MIAWNTIQLPFPTSTRTREAANHHGFVSADSSEEARFPINQNHRCKEKVIAPICLEPGLQQEHSQNHVLLFPTFPVLKAQKPNKNPKNYRDII